MGLIEIGQVGAIPSLMYLREAHTGSGDRQIDVEVVVKRELLNGGSDAIAAGLYLEGPLALEESAVALGESFQRVVLSRPNLPERISAGFLHAGLP